MAASTTKQSHAATVSAHCLDAFSNWLISAH